MPHDTLIIHSIFAVLNLWVKEKYDNMENFKNEIVTQRMQVFSSNNDEISLQQIQNIKINTLFLCKNFGKNPNTSNVKTILILEKIYNLCKWYDVVNWEDPVPMSEKYKKILDSVKTEYVNNQTIYKAPEGYDGKILAYERAKHIAKEKTFKIKLEKRLKIASVILRKLPDEYF